MITLANIFSFVSQIKNADLSKKFLVSYDVTSLLTNRRSKKQYRNKSHFQS